jgi:hypothetical protein
LPNFVEIARPLAYPFSPHHDVVVVVVTTEEEATGMSYNDDKTKTKTDTTMTMTMTTMLPSLQMGRMTNATAINQYKQQSTV